ncbi:MAG: four helix bundle protein, partial [Ignavibacteriae bacterium]
MKIQKFEDMKVWQEARTLVNQIYKSTSKQKFSKDFGLRDQIQRAAVSVMSN